MGLETAQYLKDLNANNPTGGDSKDQGDNHLRLIKAVLQSTFPHMGTVAWRTQTASSTITVDVDQNLNAFICNGTFSVNLPSAVTAGNGWLTIVSSTSGTITLVMPGQANVSLDSNDTVIALSDGANYRIAYMRTGTTFPASRIVFTPAGTIAAATVQAAIEELDAEKLGKTGTQSIDGNVNVAGTLTVGALITGAAGLNITGNGSFTGSLSSGANQSFTGTLTQTGSIVATGNGTFGGGLSVTNTISVGTGASIGGNVSIAGALTTLGRDISVGGVYADQGILRKTGQEKYIWFDGTNVQIKNDGGGPLLYNGTQLVNAVSSGNLSAGIGSGTLSINLPSILAAGSYQANNNTPTIDVDAYGRITSFSSGWTKIA